MYQLLVRLMIATAIFELGFSASEFKNCLTRQCLQKIEKATRIVSKIEWKPISVFHKEAKRF